MRTLVLAIKWYHAKPIDTVQHISISYTQINCYEFVFLLPQPGDRRDPRVPDVISGFRNLIDIRLGVGLTPVFAASAPIFYPHTTLLSIEYTLLQSPGRSPGTFGCRAMCSAKPKDSLDISVLSSAQVIVMFMASVNPYISVGTHNLDRSNCPTTRKANYLPQNEMSK